jgi:fatty acid desaturase
VTSLRIRPRSAAGLLAAAWTYNLGFGWRSAFGRLEGLERGASPVNGEASFVLPIVAVSLMIVAIVMVWALFLAWRQAVSPSPANG